MRKPASKRECVRELAVAIKLSYGNLEGKSPLVKGMFGN